MLSSEKLARAMLGLPPKDELDSNSTSPTLPSGDVSTAAALQALGAQAAALQEHLKPVVGLLFSLHAG